MQFFTALFATLVLAVSTTATPVRIAERAELIVFSPPVTSPRAGDMWLAGQTQQVTWDASKVPPGGENNLGTILLGYSTPGSTSENLDYAHPLATGFLLTDGCHNVTVPLVTPRATYFIALFGDSANLSPEFTILP